MENPEKVVTRFAPSPTGFMHIGGVRTALFAWLWARKNNGTFILRIEDTDREREVPDAISQIQEALSWLGIEWDYGPDKPGPFGSCIQSERIATHLEWAKKLIAKGLAYPDPYTEEEIAAFRAQAEAEKRPFLYRNHRPEVFEAWDGTKPLRFKVPEIKRYEWIDEVRGPLSAGEEALDDFVIIKSDGYPTYNFAHIIDDYEMGVTHILRADEFISSTPKYLALYEALEIERPKLATLPPILREDRTKKLGKRDGAKDFLEYDKEGYLPEAMMNFLALIGWNPGTDQELFSKQELIQLFSLDRIQKAGGALNEEKLDWFNREYIKKMDSEVFWSHAEVFVPAELLAHDETIAILQKMEHLIRDRIVKFGDIKELFEEGEFEYFFEEPIVDQHMLVWKKLAEDPEGLSKTKQYLIATKNILENLSEENWNQEGIKIALAELRAREGNGNILWPLRVSLSGREKSPDPFELATILGKQKTLERIQSVV